MKCLFLVTIYLTLCLPGYCLILDAVYSPPTIYRITGYGPILEIADSKFITLTGINSGEKNENQIFCIAAFSNNIDLISNLQVEYGQRRTTEVLWLTPNIYVDEKLTNTIGIYERQKLIGITEASFIDDIYTVSHEPSFKLSYKLMPIDKSMRVERWIPNSELIASWKYVNGLKFTRDNGISSSGNFKGQAASRKNDSYLESSILKAQINLDNGPPVIISTPDSTIEISKYYSYDIKATDPNELDVLTFTVVIPEFIQSWLKFVDNHDKTATISGTPPSGSIGIYEIYIKVEDQLGGYYEQVYNMSVMKLNKKPKLSPFSKNIMEDDTIFFLKEDFTLGYSDADGDTLHFINVARVPQNGTLQLNGIKLELNDTIKADEISSFTYIPKQNYFGLDIFDWNASDGKDLANVPERVHVFISSVNDPPEIIDFEPNPFTFDYGDDSIAITSIGKVIDVDGDQIEKAVVSITKNYLMGEDTLFYERIEGLNYEWQDTTGVLFIQGVAAPLVYQDAVRSLRYVNLNRLAPNGLFREIEIVLYDPDSFSISYLRRIDFENSFVDLDIPSGFTPNDDGVNDTWNIENINRYENYQIAVYSRTGKMIFKSESYIEEWDGRYQGEFVPAGNYYYLINIKKFDVIYKGTVFILR